MRLHHFLFILAGCPAPPDPLGAAPGTGSASAPDDGESGEPETGSDSGEVVCDLDPDLLDRSENGYPAGPYGTDVGDRLANSIGLLDCDGNVRDLAEFFGDCNRGVLINIGAGWCGPCQEETLDFPDVYASYHDAGIEIVQVLYQDWNAQTPTSQFCEEWRTGDWPSGEVELNAPFPVFLDPTASWSFDLLVNPASATPINLLLDANADIRWKSEGTLVPVATLQTQFDLVLADPY